jgi:hypothetical protein
VESFQLGVSGSKTTTFATFTTFSKVVGTHQTRMQQWVEGGVVKVVGMVERKREILSGGNHCC